MLDFNFSFLGTNPDGVKNRRRCQENDSYDMLRSPV